MANSETKAELKDSPLKSFHEKWEAKLVPFAGYNLPLQYKAGIIAENLYVRENAGLFDISHMGQFELAARDYSSVAEALEAVTCGKFSNLAQGSMRYSLILNADGGAIDDIMVYRPLDDENKLLVVVNGARVEADWSHFRKHLPKSVMLSRNDTLALMALQGPKAEAVLLSLGFPVEKLMFLKGATFAIPGTGGKCLITRSGYSGEDGFEISLAGDLASEFAERILTAGPVLPIGLGARDSLRLEAGLCLYGHDLDETTSPIEAGLSFAVSKDRLEKGEIIAAKRLSAEKSGSLNRLRVGLTVEGPVPVREGAHIYDQQENEIGIITSGTFSPNLKKPIAMGYVRPVAATIGTKIVVEQRGRKIPGEITRLPFLATHYKQAPSIKTSK